MGDFMRKILFSCILAISVFSCAKSEKPTETASSAVEQVIAEAETMSFEEICAKAIEESKTATMKGIGNSSRGKTA